MTSFADKLREAAKNAATLPERTDNRLYAQWEREARENRRKRKEKKTGSRLVSRG